MTLAREPLLVRCDRSRPAADVILDPDAQQKLTPTRNPAAAPGFSEIFVLLAGAEGNDGLHIEVYIGEHRLGTLTRFRVSIPAPLAWRSCPSRNYLDSRNFPGCAVGG
jgi:hypothetical protein